MTMLLTGAGLATPGGGADPYERVLEDGTSARNLEDGTDVRVLEN